MFENPIMSGGYGPTLAHEVTGICGSQAHGAAVAGDFSQTLAFNKFTDRRKVPSFAFFGKFPVNFRAYSSLRANSAIVISPNILFRHMPVSHVVGQSVPHFFDSISAMVSKGTIT